MNPNFEFNLKGWWHKIFFYHIQQQIALPIVEFESPNALQG